MMTEAQRKAGEITDTAKAKAQRSPTRPRSTAPALMSLVTAEVEQIRADIAAQQDEATKKVNELLANLEERRTAAKQEADELAGRAKNTREEADSYARPISVRKPTNVRLDRAQGR